MPQPSSATRPAAYPVRVPSILAAFLSYLVPGVGQMYQGRIGKGLLFFFCLYGLFFYGMWLGHGEARAGDQDSYRISSNVYWPDTATVLRAEHPDWSDEKLREETAQRNPLGLPRPLANLYNRPQFAGQVWMGVAAWPAIWQYQHPGGWFLHPILGNFEATPPEWAINEVQRNTNKLWDLGWVCTVIAGVLNILVIYDAYAGPLFVVRPTSPGTVREAVA
jgi:hypothetical protein